MAFKPTELTDCLIISKKFERGAIFSSAPQAPYAMLTPVLDGMRTQSRGFKEQADTTKQISTPKSTREESQTPQAGGANATGLQLTGNQTSSNIVSNMDKADEDDPGLLERVAGNFGLINENDEFSLNGIFDSKCIPCGLRLTDLASVEIDVGQGIDNAISEFLEFYEGVFRKMWNQLQRMILLFNNANPFIDLCAFIKFFTEFMCVPDIARMLSALMALLNRQSFQFDGIFDLILQLVGPLFSPFLGNFVAMLERYIAIILGPLECIIDSIQGLLSKLDYNVLFTNISSLDKQLDLGGPKMGANLPGNSLNEQKYRRTDPRGDYRFRLGEPRLDENEPKTIWVDGQLPRRDIVDGPRFAETGFNVAGPVSTYIEAENAQNQRAVDESADNLRTIRRNGQFVDGSNPEAIRAQREKERNAEKEYRAAIEKRNLSYIGRANKRIDEGVAGLKSSLMMVIGYLREAISEVRGFFNYLHSEFKKLVGEYLGGGDSMIGQIINKQALTQLIAMINQIYKAVQRGAICPDDAQDIKVENWIQIPEGKVWTDEEGLIHVEGNDDEIEDAVDEVVKAFGTESPGGITPQQRDKNADVQSPSQKLNSLIELTGDPTLDMEIARTTEQFTSPMNVTFKCPLQTGVAQTEQINKWIAEVNEF